MNKVLARRFCMLTVAMALIAGCATTRQEGIQASLGDINAIERIAKSKNSARLRLSDYEGVALLALGKAGVYGIGGLGWTASVYVKDLAKKEYGPPSFVGYGGFSLGLGYAGINAVDCMILFKNRDDAIRFAVSKGHVTFTNEASFLVWGRKSMSGLGTNRYSDGAGISLGFVELEFVLGGPRDTLHANLYEKDVTVERILAGDVVIPEELKEGLKRLNGVMRSGEKPIDDPYGALEQLRKLKDAGTITDEEFQGQKKKILDQR